MDTRHIVGYVRVSTEEQAECGVSLAAQEEKVRGYAALNDLGEVDLIVDRGASAKSLKRPGMERLLAAVRRGQVAAVIVLKLDRLTRSVRDLAELLETFERHGVDLHAVQDKIDTTTAAGRLLLNVMTSVAQWEREAIAERTRLALAHKRNKGQVYCGTPFGYRREGDRLVAVEDEQAILVRVRELRSAGATLQDIADELTAAGVPTKRGGRWAPATVARILGRTEAA